MTEAGLLRVVDAADAVEGWMPRAQLEVLASFATLVFDDVDYHGVASAIADLVASGAIATGGHDARLGIYRAP